MSGENSLRALLEKAARVFSRIQGVVEDESSITNWRRSDIGVGAGLQKLDFTRKCTVWPRRSCRA